MQQTGVESADTDTPTRADIGDDSNPVLNNDACVKSAYNTVESYCDLEGDPADAADNGDPDGDDDTSDG